MGQSVIGTSLEVDPQIPSHVSNLRPGAMCEPTSARRRVPERKTIAVVFERPRKHSHEDNATPVDRDHLGRSRVGLFVPNRDQLTQGDRDAGGEVLHAGVRQAFTIPAVVVDPQIPAHDVDARSRKRKARRLLKRGRTPGSLPTPTGSGRASFGGVGPTVKQIQLPICGRHGRLCTSDRLRVACRIAAVAALPFVPPEIGLRTLRFPPYLICPFHEERKVDPASSPDGE